MLNLKAEKRKEKGDEVKSLRKEGFVPAVLYGPKIKILNLAVEEKTFRKVFNEVGEASMFNLEIEGDSKKTPVLIKEAQIHPLTDRFIHIDFYQPILTEKVETTVPLVFEGEAPAVKEKEGVLVRNISEVEVSALPKNLPSEIKVSIDGLKDFNDVIYIKDLSLPKGVRALRDGEDVVATISAPKTAEELMEEMERKEEEELFVGEEVPLEPVPEEEEAVEEEEEQEGIEL